ncbi:MAG: hypothetical protein RQ824_01515 [bacterium]|nr:hypothetical protein [bacterium]
MKKSVLITVLLLISPLFSHAEPLELRGELSSWLSYRDLAPDYSLLGLRYIPQVSLAKALSNGRKIDGLVSANINFEAPTDRLQINDENSETEFYRLWARWSSNQFEARAGLQKINFGPAKILRSLRWFDTIDARDPSGLTDGVKGLLLRYYALDNTNIWLWGLYGNDEIKGLEVAPTDGARPELGGRYQTPMINGEMAISLHHRKIDRDEWRSSQAFGLITSNLIDGGEDRIAIDGFWDVEIGLWFEAVAGRIKVDSNLDLWGEQMTIGADYTLDSGIHILGEHFVMATGDAWDKTVRGRSTSALSADYGISIMDRINSIITYDWVEHETQGFIGWQRTYDDWRIDLLGFSGPEVGSGKFSGDRVELIVTYNH